MQVQYNFGVRVHGAKCGYIRRRVLDMNNVALLLHSGGNVAAKVWKLPRRAGYWGSSPNQPLISSSCAVDEAILGGGGKEIEAKVLFAAKLSGGLLPASHAVNFYVTEPGE